MNNKHLLLSGVALLCCISISPALADEDVDLELQLLIDTSGSISSQEYDLQMRGYSYAFQESSIQDAILDTSDGSYGSIAVQTVMWSSQGTQQAMTDWTLLDSASSINSYADTLYNMSRPFSGATYNAEALDYGSTLFTDNNFNGTRSVIDMSGDGYGYDYMYSDRWWFNGGDTSIARDNALLGGIDTINGLTITYDYAQVGDMDLTTWFSNNVIGGTDSFVLQAGDFADFTVALEQKLEAEIEGGYIPTNAIGPGEVYSAPAPLAGSSLLSLLLLSLYRVVDWTKEKQNRRLYT
ncbi:MAG: hypothetical protein COA45_11325 [Zetaproteobacteria bacterium]|nr:MAG: hypothetical protein COA45_11325 [Zetaproteobacteria bacterium]